MQGETAERILDSANALLIDRGYSAFSYADIAEAVSIRKASIHHHFPTKSGLVVAVLRRHRDRIAQGMRSIDERFADPFARIQDYFHYWQRCIQEQTFSFCIGALLAAEMPSLPVDVQTEIRLHFSMLTDWFEQTLQQGIAQGRIHLRGTVATEVQMLIAILHGAMLSARATGSADLFRSITQAALQPLIPEPPIPAKA